jgi:hypothetical protein
MNQAQASQTATKAGGGGRASRSVSPGQTHPKARRTAATLLVALVLLPGAAARVSARSPTELDIQPELDHGVLGEGRQAYRERRDHQRAWESYHLFKRHSAANMGDPIGAWHLSMSCYYLGIRVSRDSEQKTKLFAEGLEHAERGVENDPECGPCHLMLAVNGALWGQQVGIFRTIVGLPRVHHHLARAEEIDPHFGGAAVHRVRAYINRALPRLFGGGPGAARKSIEKAIQVAPEEHLNYAFLTLLLVRDYEDVDAAVRVARTGLAVPEPAPAYVESVDAFEVMTRFVARYGSQQRSKTEANAKEEAKEKEREEAKEEANRSSATARHR